MPTQSCPDKSSQGRIGYVVKRYPRYSETFIVNEILAHEADGLDVDIFALRPPVDTHFQNGISQVRAPVHYLPSGSVKSTEFWKSVRNMDELSPEIWPTLAKARHASVVDVYQAVRLAEHVRERKINHLHAHFATAAATVAQMAARIADISFSVTMHAKDIFHESVDPADLESKIADSRFVVTVSEFNRDYLAGKFGFQEKIHCIYNGLDLDLFQFHPPTDGSKKICAVGRLVPKKGFTHLIEACRILSENRVDFTCDVIGSGELESDLNNQITSSGLQDQVKLLGPLPQNIVLEKICASTVLAAPCVVGPDGNRDGLPTVITESLALGTPCISTDVTGIPEIIRHGKTGILVTQGSATELADELNRLLSDQKLCLALAQNARQLVESEFDGKNNVARIRELFPLPAVRTTNLKTTQLQGV